MCDWSHFGPLFLQHVGEWQFYVTFSLLQLCKIFKEPFKWVDRFISG